MSSRSRELSDPHAPRDDGELAALRGTGAKPGDATPRCFCLDDVAGVAAPAYRNARRVLSRGHCAKSDPDSAISEDGLDGRPIVPQYRTRTPRLPSDIAGSGPVRSGDFGVR